MNSSESIVKIVTQYFAPMTNETFVFRGKTYHPKTLRVSPMMFERSMACPAYCGGCCARLSVEYIKPEIDEIWNSLSASESYKKADGEDPRFSCRSIKVGEVSRPVWSDLQKENKDHFCHYLTQEDGRCSIHGRHPFSCDFELLRFSIMSDPDRANQFNHRPFGRGWAMLTVDGTRGAKCIWENETIDYTQINEIVRKLKRLKQWMEYWELSHKVDRVIDWVESGPHKKPLFIASDPREEN
jgi:Fe-S-cluster containining protein